MFISYRKKMINRMCAITRKILPRTELFRLVRTKDGNIFFDKNYNIPGRGIHFSKDPKIVAKFFDPQKRGMVAHMLKVRISGEKMEEMEKEVKNLS